MMSNTFLVPAGAEVPASMVLTLRANIWAQQLGALMNKGLSSSDPESQGRWHACLR